MSLTLAIARDAPVGVVIAAWSGRLSRMYSWNVLSDELTPGQFLRARSSVLAISPDGKYVVYYAEAFHKKEQAFIGVSHLPYFTAQAFYLQFHLGARCAKFQEDGSLDVWTIRHEYSWVKGRGEIEERIAPNCPFTIRRHDWHDLVLNRAIKVNEDTSWAEDSARDRRILADGLDLIEYKPPGHNRRLIASIPKEKFQEVTPPDWARQW